MPGVFDIIGTSMEFYKKHPLLNQVVGWLLVLPLSLSFVVTDLMSENGWLFSYLMETAEMSKIAISLMSAILNLGFSIWLWWGCACVLLIGKRMVKSSAGRSRSSIKTVREQGSKFIVPLFLTDILRDCFTFFWLLILIVPGLVYRVRTIFFHVIIVCEGKEYRDALDMSKEIVTGRSWTVFWYQLGITVALFFPMLAVVSVIQGFILAESTRFFLVANILSATVISLTLALYLLATITLYKEVKSLPKLAHG